MQQIGNGSYLLDRMYDNTSSLSGELVLHLDGGLVRNPVECHLQGCQILPEPIVQFARNAPSFCVLQQHQATRHLTQLLIQVLRVHGLTLHLDENTNFRTQELGNYRYRNIIHGAQTVALESIEICQIYGGYENDCGFLKSWMLANHLRQFKAINFWHVYVQQHNRDISFQQDRQSFLCGTSSNQVFTKLAEDFFISE